MRKLAAVLPDFAQELVALLHRQEPALAAQVARLPVVDRCRCGETSCATFYTAAPPAGGYGPKHESIDLDAEAGAIILDTVDGEIVCVEVLNRDAVRDQLRQLLP